MDKKMMSSCQVIGLCAKTQTISLDDECKLMVGISYNIDIHQDFSGVSYNGCPVAEMSALAAVDAICMADQSLCDADGHTCDAETFHQGSGLWVAVAKIDGMDRRAERKWKRDKKARKERVKQFWEEYDSGEFFLSEKQKAALKQKRGVQDD